MTAAMQTADNPADLESAERLAAAAKSLREEISKAIVGQHDVIEQLMISLFSNTHCFMVGVPGLAKTLMVSSLAKLLDLSFKRIQFTPDLMPSDITGTEILQSDPDTGQMKLEYVHGPLFANMVLADEINRCPPKTQAALLEAMQERQITAGGETRKLKPPFFVLATQNPIEQEGTYPLPEAQLDRFMLNIWVDYPEKQHELDVLKTTTVKRKHEMNAVLTAEEIVQLQDTVFRVPVGDHVFDYALELVRKTRPSDESAPDYVKEWLEAGAGPRAGQNLILGAKARALIHGRFYASCDDVKALAHPVLRHRIMTNFNAESDGIKPDQIIDKLLKDTPIRTK